MSTGGPFNAFFVLQSFLKTNLPLFFIPGGCCGSRSKKTRVGGWAWAWWLVTDVQRLSLEVRPTGENKHAWE